MKEFPKLLLTLLHILVVFLSPFQICVLYVCDVVFRGYFRIVGRGKRARKVVIGVTETARIIHFLGEVFPSSYTCVLDRNRFYQDPYDFGPYPLWARVLVGPILLAYLSQVGETFIYISFTGFMADRELDFRFLKRKSKKIVTLFCGSDIRSLKKTKAFFDHREEDSFANYLPNTFNPQYDRMMKKVAKVADTHADLIFNWSVDQISYLTKPTQPWPYMFDMEQYPYEFGPLVHGDKVVVLHAPNNPTIKGTPLVRAAVKKLRLEGFDFTYVELLDVPNHVVLEALGKSHIVLQEFYFSTIGVLGVEALARGNAVLVSADRVVNPELPEDCEGAWVVTHYWEIYDNLKYLLENPHLIEQYARCGREFVAKHYDFPQAREYYRAAFEKHQVPF